MHHIKLVRMAVIYIASLALLLVGCVPTTNSVRPVNDNYQLTESEQRLEAASEPFQSTVLQGAAVGAAAGGLLGALTGGDVKSAITGALLGGVAGGAGGYYVAKKQEHYASEEARIDSMISDAKTTNIELETYIAAVKDYVADSVSKANSLRQQMQKDEISNEEYKSRLTRIRKQQTNMEASLDDLNQKKDSYTNAMEEQKKISGEESVAQLDQQIKILQRQIKTLEGQITTLDQVLQVSLV